MLVVGAGDRAAQAAALHLSALGAAVVAAGPSLDGVVVTAGLVAASGGTVRVVERPAPPLASAELVRLATEALEPPTDAVLSAATYATRAAAHEAARELSSLLAPGARVAVLEAVPAGEERAAALRLVARFLPEGGSAGAAEGTGSLPIAQA